MRSLGSILGGGDRPDREVPEYLRPVRRVDRSGNEATIYEVADEDAYYAALRAYNEERSDAPACGRCRDARYVVATKDPLVLEACPACAAVDPVERLTRVTGFRMQGTFEEWRHDARTEPMYLAVRDVVAGRRWCAFLRAGVGTGKTHLSSAATWALMTDGVHVRFWSVGVLVARLRETQAQDAREKLDDFMRARVSSAAVLVLDDLGAERYTDFAAEQVYLIVDHFYQRRDEKRLIVTTNVDPDAPDAWERIPARVADRLSSGEVIVRGAPSRRREFDG